jgi:hypothetical protein
MGREMSQEIVGLRQANGYQAGQLYIQTAPDRHRKRIAVWGNIPTLMVDVGVQVCVRASEQQVPVRLEISAALLDYWAEQIREHVPAGGENHRAPCLDFLRIDTSRAYGCPTTLKL